MTLCDAGPLVALVDRNDARHADALVALDLISQPLVTTWACLAEAMFIVGRRSGSNGQQALWQIMQSPVVSLYINPASELQHLRELMLKYDDLPMDLADASLVAAAEALDISRIFTFDSDFQVYRLGDGRAFEIIP